MNVFKTLVLITFVLSASLSRADEIYAPHFACFKSICDATKCPESTVDHLLVLINDKNYRNGKTIIYARAGAFSYNEENLPAVKASPELDGPERDPKEVYETGLVKLEGVLGLRDPIFVKYEYVLPNGAKDPIPSSSVISESSMKKLFSQNDDHFKVIDRGTIAAINVTTEKDTERMLLIGLERRVNSSYDRLFIRKSLLRADEAPSYDEMIEAAESINEGCKSIQNDEFQTFMKKDKETFEKAIEQMRQKSPEAQAIKRNLRQA